MARLDIALLGRLHVTLDAQPVTGLRYDKVRALLAYLVAEQRRAHRRSALAALLWPDASEGDARKSLRNALATLRQAIGDPTSDPPFLLITRDTIQFNPDADVQLDVALFDGHCASLDQHQHPKGALCTACVQRLQQAIELYRGDFLDHIAMLDSLAWDEWALLLRERLHRQMLDALTQLVAYHEHQGEDDAARRCAWRALMLEPWNEGMHRCLMRVHARGGQRGAALAQYERCCHILAEELGVEPAVETTALYERIRAGPLEKAVAAPRSAIDLDKSTPHATNTTPGAGHRTSFGGASTVSVATTMRRGHAVAAGPNAPQHRWAEARLLTLMEPPVGNTARFGLAIPTLPHNDPDGLYFIALVPVNDPSLISTAMIQAPGIDAAGIQELATHLQRYFCDSALQLVLDNFARVLNCLVVSRG